MAAAPLEFIHGGLLKACDRSSRGLSQNRTGMEARPYRYGTGSTPSRIYGVKIDK